MEFVHQHNACRLMSRASSKSRLQHAKAKCGASILPLLPPGASYNAYELSTQLCANLTSPQASNCYNAYSRRRQAKGRSRDYRHLARDLYTSGASLRKQRISCDWTDTIVVEYEPRQTIAFILCVSHRKWSEPGSACQRHQRPSAAERSQRGIKDDNDRMIARTMHAGAYISHALSTIMMALRLQ